MSATSPEPRIEDLRRMPKGAQRDPSAQCYISAPGMRKGIIAGKTLKPTRTRDGSIPILSAEVENAKSAEDTTLDSTVKRSYSHLNTPREDEIIGRTFEVHYVDATRMDEEVRFVLVPEKGGGEGVVLLQEKMDGNRVQKEIERPELEKGFYKLSAQLLGSGGEFAEDVAVSVYIE